MKLYIEQRNTPKRRLKIQFGTAGTGNFNPSARAEKRNSQNVISTKSAKVPSQASHRMIYLNPDQEPPEHLLHELFAIAADIQTRRAVMSPSPGATEPLRWDRDRGQYLFNPRH